LSIAFSIFILQLWIAHCSKMFYLTDSEYDMQQNVNRMSLLLFSSA
jgi:hypothetical protein